MDNITYKKYTDDFLDGVLRLQNEWAYENITFGVIADSEEDIKSYGNEYFHIAFDGDTVIGYAAAEAIAGNEFNVFPKGADYLRINDLYVKKEYRNKRIGETLLKIVETKAHDNGIRHIFVSSAAKDADAARNFYTRNGYGIWTTMYYKREGWDVRTYDLNELGGYRFVVIFARYKGQWIYSRHKERDTYETAGGHIERGESPAEAAKRELYEETGALDFEIRPAFDYSVHTGSGFSNGQVYIAEIRGLGALPDSEMCGIKLFDTIPEQMTYPHILPVLYEKIKEMK